MKQTPAPSPSAGATVRLSAVSYLSQTNLVLTAPLATETSHVTTFKQGWLLKKGVGNRSWKRRYMVLRMGRSVS